MLPTASSMVLRYAINNLMIGRISAIFVAPTRHAEQSAIDAVQLKMAKGIVGDRYFGRNQKHPERNLTLIEAEVIESFNRTYGQSIEYNATRRNLITRGIRLNELAGKNFLIGQVLCQGIELCEPCAVLARQLSASGLSSSEIIRAFKNKGGLKAEILTNGIVYLGDRLSAVDNS